MFFSFYLAKNPVSDRKELVSATIWNCFTCSFCGKLAMQNIFVFLPFLLFSERTHECYYLLLPGFLLKQWEIGHEKYVFFSFCLFLFFLQRILCRQKRTHQCYYLLLQGFLLKQWEIGHSKYVFLLSVFFSFFLAKNTFYTEKNARVLLFGTVARVPFKTAGNLPCKICFFLLVLFSEKNA